MPDIEDERNRRNVFGIAYGERDSIRLIYDGSTLCFLVNGKEVIDICPGKIERTRKAIPVQRFMPP